MNYKLKVWIVKVSVITACYNAENQIEETLRSVIKQTYSDIEYIIVDGASTDNTLEIIKKYGEKVSKIISEKDNGIYNAMNKGIKAASGDLIFFLNADDVFINEIVVEKFSEEAEKTAKTLLLGDILMLNRYTGEYYYEKQYFIDKMQLLNSTVFHPATFFKREVFEKYGIYNENNRVVSDYEWYVKYFINGGDYKYVNIPVTIFSLGQGLSSNNSNVDSHKNERIDVQAKYFSEKELKQFEFLKKFFPRKINKHSFRKNLAKLGLNTIY